MLYDAAIPVQTPGLLNVESSSQHRRRGMLPKTPLKRAVVVGLARKVTLSGADHGCGRRSLSVLFATATGWEHGGGRRARGGLTCSVGGLTGYGCGADAELRARFRVAAYGDRRCPADVGRIGKSYSRLPAVPTLCRRCDRRARQAQ